MKSRLTIFLIALLFSVHVFACSCDDKSLQEKINSADYIYLGQVIESELIEKNKVRSKLLVIEKIKGYPQTHYLDSYIGKYNMCKMYVATGIDYIVYGNIGKTPVISSVCSRSQPILSDIKKHVQEIRNRVNSD